MRKTFKTLARVTVFPALIGTVIVALAWLQDAGVTVVIATPLMWTGVLVTLGVLERLLPWNGDFNRPDDQLFHDFGQHGRAEGTTHHVNTHAIVLMNGIQFFAAKSSGLSKNGIRNANLANVVQQCCDFKNVTFPQRQKSFCCGNA